MDHFITVDSTERQDRLALAQLAAWMAAVSAPARAPMVAWGHAVAGTAMGSSIGVPRGDGLRPHLEAWVGLPANIPGLRVHGDGGTW